MADHLCDQHCDPECEVATEDWGDYVDRPVELTNLDDDLYDFDEDGDSAEFVGEGDLR